MIKYGLTVGGLIAIFIIAFYVFGLGPTNVELTKKDNLFDQNATKLNQTGHTEPYATVTLNGEIVPVDKNGNFYKVVDVHEGQNIINVTSKAPFKSTSFTYAIVTKKEDKNGVTVDWDCNNTVQVPQ